MVSFLMFLFTALCLGGIGLVTSSNVSKDAKGRRLGLTKVDFRRIGTVGAKTQGGTRDESWNNPLANLPCLFARDGWDEGQGGHPHVYYGTAVEIKAAYAEREAMLAEVEASEKWVLYYAADGKVFPAMAEGLKPVTMSGAEAGQKLRKMFKAGPAIDLIANSGNRRTYSMGLSQLAYLHANPAADLFPMPVIVCEYETDVERLADRLRENNPAGKSNYTEKDKLHAACMLAALGWSRAQIVGALNISDGTAQRYMLFHRVNVNRPELKLMERVSMAQPTKKSDDGKRDVVDPAPAYTAGGWFPLSTLTNQALLCMVGQGGTSSDDAKLARQLGMVEDKQVQSATTIERLIAAKMGDTRNAKKIVGKDAIERLLANNPATPANAVIRATLQAILDGTTEPIAAALAGTWTPPVVDKAEAKAKATEATATEATATEAKAEAKAEATARRSRNKANEAKASKAKAKAKASK